MADNAQAYNIAAIRKLLLAAFTPEELQRFCQDRPVFSPIIAEFGPGHGLSDMVGDAITYCEKHLLFRELLAEIEQVNPRQYVRFEPYRLPPNTIPGRPRQPTRWTLTLLLNVLILGALATILAALLGPKLVACLPCQSLWTKALGLPVVLLAILQAGWRLFRSQSPYTSGRLVPLLDVLHFWSLPNLAIYLGALVMIAVAALLVCLVPGPPEPTPTVASYSVHYVNSGLTVSLTLVEAASQGIKIERGDSVLIKANIMDNADVRCTWYSVLAGRLNIEQGCAAWYHAGLQDTDDIVGILIESRCGTRERWVSIPIKVKQP